MFADWVMLLLADQPHERRETDEEQEGRGGDCNPPQPATNRKGL